MSSVVIAIFLLSIGASFIQRTTGFGFGIFIMTMLPFMMPSYGEATTLSGLLAITTSATIAWRLRSYVCWQRLWPILLTFVVVSTVSIFALTRIEDHVLRRILGVTLVLISIYFMLFSQKIKLSTTKKAAIEREKSDVDNGSSEREQARSKVKVQVGAGTLSGLMGGFFGMQGPPAVLYFILSEPSKEHYMAMTQTYFLIGNVMMTFIRAYNDRPDRLLFRTWWGHHRHTIGVLCLQPYPQPHLPLCRLCLHSGERCHYSVDKLNSE